MLAAIFAIGGLYAADNASAQSSNVSPATDFRFDSAFAVDPPDPVCWEAPPGGLLEDGRYIARMPDGGRDIFPALGTEYSGVLLESPQWQHKAFIPSCHEQLLEAQLADLSERGMNRVVSTSSAMLDVHFPLHAIERRVLLEDISNS